MGAVTAIQWCDSTTNPTYGCDGCELWRTPSRIFEEIDKELIDKFGSKWQAGKAEKTFLKIYKHHEKDAYLGKVITSELNQLAEPYSKLVAQSLGQAAEQIAYDIIRQNSACYAGQLHLRWRYSIVKTKPPKKHAFAPVFEKLTYAQESVSKAAGWSDLRGTKSPRQPWKNGLPRLTFVSDMSDSFTDGSKTHFDWLKEHAITPIVSEKGRRHLWLWLTKRPAIMARFGRHIGGFPDHIVPMTTLTSPDKESTTRLDKILEIPSQCRGLSIEPMRERIPPSILEGKDISWVILGGESGVRKYAKPFDIEWAREWRDYCSKNGIAFFLKQLGTNPVNGTKRLSLLDDHGGDWDEWDPDLRVREFPKYFHSMSKGFTSNRKRPAPKTTKIANPLTAKDKADYRKLKLRVNKAAKCFVEAAAALWEIKQRKLYREEHQNFHEYCQSVFEISRQYAYKLMAAGKMREELSPIVDKLGLVLPDHESHYRELARVPDIEKKAEVLRLAKQKSNGQGPTALVLREIIDERFPRPSTSKTPDNKPDIDREKAKAALCRLERAIKRNGKWEKNLEELRNLLGV